MLQRKFFFRLQENAFELWFYPADFSIESIAAQGGMITLASYSQFKNNNLGDTLIICVGKLEKLKLVFNDLQWIRLHRSTAGL